MELYSADLAGLPKDVLCCIIEIMSYMVNAIILSKCCKKLHNKLRDYIELEKCKPIYEKMDGWKTDISGARKMSDLPTNARKYVERISKYLGVPIPTIGATVYNEGSITLILLE